MTLGKIFIDNRVNYIAQHKQTKVRNDEPNTIKNNSLLKKQQNKNISQNNENLFKNVAAKGSAFKE